MIAAASATAAAVVRCRNRPRMRGSIPRSARVPHTEKRPERCPHCGSTAIVGVAFMGET